MSIFPVGPIRGLHPSLAQDLFAARPAALPSRPSCDPDRRRLVQSCRTATLETRRLLSVPIPSSSVTPSLSLVTALHYLSLPFDFVYTLSRHCSSYGSLNIPNPPLPPCLSKRSASPRSDEISRPTRKKISLGNHHRIEERSPCRSFSPLGQRRSRQSFTTMRKLCWRRP